MVRITGALVDSRVATRAYIYGIDGGFYQVFRRFLSGLEFSEVRIFTDPSEIVDALNEGVWPVVFLDSNENSPLDSLGMMDRLYATRGFELLSFVLLGSAEDSRILRSAHAIGARAGVVRPLHPAEASKALAGIMPKVGDTWALLAQGVSKLLLLGDYEGARTPLLRLTGNPVHEKGAEVALLRNEIALGQFSRAEERLVRLLKRFPSDLRIYCEAADFFRATTQHSLAIRFLREIEKTNVLPHRSWDRACACLECDDLNGAAQALEELGKSNQFRSVATMGFLQLMVAMGLQDYLVPLAKGSPLLSRRCADFLGVDMKAGKP
jgi:hypothetical protein